MSDRTGIALRSLTTQKWLKYTPRPETTMATVDRTSGAIVKRRWSFRSLGKSPPGWRLIKS
jgi:hypothetical protein